MPDLDLPGLLARSMTAVRHDVPGIYLPMRVSLLYELASPLAVRLAFPLERVWVVDRGLLVRGMAERAGQGDVRVRPYSDEIWTDRIEVQLHNGAEPAARLLFEREAVQAFLDASLRCVPIGDELIDTDSLIDRLCTEGR